ncbi:MAG: DUF370 domain-containing protein [candidate division KSB1 bacterium]|nr:DUF370 domain-containing protein [candidate division KSB1 bacterium]
MISVGYRNYVALERIIAVISPDSRPIKSLITGAREKGQLIDATMGKKTKSVVVTDSNQIILSANTTETIIHRIKNQLGT